MYSLRILAIDLNDKNVIALLLRYVISTNSIMSCLFVESLDCYTMDFFFKNKHLKMFSALSFRFYVIKMWDDGLAEMCWGSLFFAKTGVLYICFLLPEFSLS